jgi:hypothetical protein
MAPSAKAKLGVDNFSVTEKCPTLLDNCRNISITLIDPTAASGALSRVTRRRAVTFVLASLPAGADLALGWSCSAIGYGLVGLEVFAVLPDGPGIMRISPRRFA